MFKIKKFNLCVSLYLIKQQSKLPFQELLMLLIVFGCPLHLRLGMNRITWK